METKPLPPAPTPNAPRFPDGWIHLVEPHELAGVRASALGYLARVALDWDSSRLVGQTGAKVNFEISRAPSSSSVARTEATNTLVHVTFRWHAKRSADAGEARLGLEGSAHSAARLYEAALAFTRSQPGVALTEYSASHLGQEVVLGFAVAGRGEDLLQDVQHAIRVHQRLLRAYASAPVVAPFMLPALPSMFDTYLDRALADGASASDYAPGSCIELIERTPGDDDLKVPLVDVVVTGDSSHPLLARLEAVVDRRLPLSPPDRIPLADTMEAQRTEVDTRAHARVAYWYAQVEELRHRGFDVVVYPPTYGLEDIALTCCLRLDTTNIGEAFKQGDEAAAVFSLGEAPFRWT